MTSEEGKLRAVLSRVYYRCGCSVTFLPFQLRRTRKSAVSAVIAVGLSPYIKRCCKIARVGETMPLIPLIPRNLALKPRLTT